MHEIKLYNWKCVNVDVWCVCVFVSVVLAEGKMQPSKTLLLEQKYDSNIIFFCSVFNVSQETQSPEREFNP